MLDRFAIEQVGAGCKTHVANRRVIRHRRIGRPMFRNDRRIPCLFDDHVQSEAQDGRSSGVRAARHQCIECSQIELRKTKCNCLC